MRAAAEAGSQRCVSSVAAKVSTAVATVCAAEAREGSSFIDLQTALCCKLAIMVRLP